MRLEYAPGLDRLAAEHLDRNLIPLLRGCPDQAEEHPAHVGPERPELPVHPPLGVGALPRVLRPHRARPVPGGEIAHYGVGFPRREAVIGDHGYQTVRVEREVLGITGEARSAASVDGLVLRTQLLAAPQHLLDVYGILPASDLQHASPSIGENGTAGILQSPGPISLTVAGDREHMR